MARSTRPRQAGKVREVVTGIPEIDAKLRTLEFRVQSKLLRQAMRKGMKLVLADAKARAPVDTGLMARSVKLRAMRRSRSRQGLLVQVNSAEGLVKTTKAGERYFYPAVVEFGDGETPAHPFLRPAYDRQGPPARDVTMRELLSGTLREVKT